MAEFRLLGGLGECCGESQQPGKRPAGIGLGQCPATRHSLAVVSPYSDTRNDKAS